MREGRLELPRVGSLWCRSAGYGAPLLALHGNPTSGRLYRPLLEGPPPGWRVIAPDLPGFGRSAGAPHGPRALVPAVRALIDAISDGPATLLLHDWAGPVGLAAAAARPQAVAGLVLVNTWAFPADPRLAAFSLFAGNPLAERLEPRARLFGRIGLRLALNGVRERAELIRESPAHAARFAGAIGSERAWLEGLERRSRILADRPVRIVLGARDPLLGRRSLVARWRRLFPRARAVRVDAGHFLPLERPDAIRDAVAAVRAPEGAADR